MGVAVIFWYYKIGTIHVLKYLPDSQIQIAQKYICAGPEIMCALFYV